MQSSTSRFYATG